MEPAQIRIGDTERESALTALSEHMTAGRLDIDEYGDRTARVSTAKTRGELLQVFGDLPEPHPTFGTAAPPPPVPEPQRAPMPVSAMSMSMRQRVAASAVPLAAFIAVILFFTVVHWWGVFLLPAAVVLFGGVIFGDDWRHQNRLAREERRQQVKAIRRRGRDW